MGILKRVDDASDISGIIEELIEQRVDEAVEAKEEEIRKEYGDPDDLVCEIDELREENKDLKAEIETWKRRAQQFELALCGRR